MDINGWKLPRSTWRRTGRAHTGLIRRDGSNERWCSDGLEIACWNGDVVQIAFALDCHDREVIAHVAVPRDLRGSDIRDLMHRAVTARFGCGTRPDAPVQWLSDTGSKPAVERHGGGFREHTPTRLHRRRRSLIG